MGQVTLYSRTLDQVRPAALAEGKRGAEPMRYVCSAEKLQRKGLLNGSTPVVEDVDPKLVARYWPMRSILREHEHRQLTGGCYFACGCTLAICARPHPPRALPCDPPRP